LARFSWRRNTCEKLSPEDFYLEQHRTIFGAMLSLNGGRMPDLTNLIGHLREQGLLEAAGGDSYLASLWDLMPACTQVLQYAATVEALSKRRQVIEIGQRLVRDAYRIEDPGGTVGWGRAALAKLDTAAAPSRGEAALAPPPLPDGVQPDPEIGVSAGWWVRLYTGYASDVSPMTPALFQESAAIWLGALAIARRLKLAMPFGDVYPNLFVLWLAPTTLYRKSTALDVARHVARRVVPHLLAAQEVTPEALLSDLAGREPPMMDAIPEQDRATWTARRNYAAQRGIILDEMSGLLSGAGKDYNAGLVESLLRLYDCDPWYERSTRGQGLVIVRNACLSLLGASTPAAMQPHMRAAHHLWHSGWWSRFAVLTPEGGRPEYQEPREAREPPELCDGLRELDSRLPAAKWPDPPEARHALLGKGVYGVWARYNRALSYDLLTDDLDANLHGTYGRLPALALKVAMILAALDGWEGNVPTVEMPHLARAIEVCEAWRASAHRVLGEAARSDSDRLTQRILKQAGKFGAQGPTMRDLEQGMRDVPKLELGEDVTRMVKAGLLAEVPYQSKLGGPTTKRYPVAVG